MKNSIELDVTDSPELRDIFSGKEIGEACELTVRFQLNESSPTTVKGTIESVTPHSGYGSDDDEGEKKEAIPDPDHPVAIVMMAGPSKESKREAASY